MLTLSVSSFDRPWVTAATIPADPDAVLDGLEVAGSDLTVRGVPFREAVSLAYERLITAAEAEALESG